MHTHACAWTCESQRWVSGLFLYCFPALFFETGSLSEAGAWQFSLGGHQQAPGFLLSLSPQHWAYRCMPPPTPHSFILELEIALGSSCLHGRHLTNGHCIPLPNGTPAATSPFWGQILGHRTHVKHRSQLEWLKAGAEQPSRNSLVTSLTKTTLCLPRNIPRRACPARLPPPGRQACISPFISYPKCSSRKATRACMWRLRY